MGKYSKPPIRRQDADPMEDQLSTHFVRKVTPKTDNQRRLLEALRVNTLTVAIGPAGCGKTFLTVSAAVEAINEGTVDRIILTRPAVEAGESLGYLPGDLMEKMDPYLRPLYDALLERMGGKALKNHIATKTIEIAPIAFMRGRTLNNAYIIIDEAQNCTFVQLKMLLTRLGWNSVMVLTGDPNQSDLPGTSGLTEMCQFLRNIPEVAVVDLYREDIVRHPLIGKILAEIGGDGE